MDLRETVARAMYERLRRIGPVMCFGTTKAGHPKHPLYLKAGTPLVPFEGSSQ